MIKVTRTYQNQEETEQKIRVFLEQMRRDGELILPPERVLCEKLFCSRETLRRVFETQEAKGFIIKKRRARSISMKVIVPSPIGSFAFIARGQGMICNLAWNKLWTALSQMTEVENISTKLILIPYLASEEDCLNILHDLPEIIIMTTVNNHFILKGLSGKTVITSEEHYRGLFRNTIAMDNYEAGFLCAEKLAEHGYRKPAIICNKLIGDGNSLYIPYERRSCGFLDGCRKFGLEINKKSEFWISGKNYKLTLEIIKAGRAIVDAGFDSLFLHTDDEIDSLYEALIEKCRIPEDVGLVTVNSFDNAIMHDPPISAASHGTKPVAAMLIKQIKRIIETGEKNIGEIMIKPTFHKGETLR